MKSDFSLFSFSKYTDEEIIDDATQEFAWIGDKARLFIYLDDDDDSWKAIGLAGLSPETFIDYEKKLEHPRDWIRALQWLIEQEEA